jgi:hypothetical protein
MNADIARRTIYEKMHPLSFTEYLKITKQKYEVKGLGKKISDIIFNSEDAKTLFTNIKNLSLNNSYFSKTDNSAYEMKKSEIILALLFIFYSYFSKVIKPRMSYFYYPSSWFSIRMPPVWIILLF